MTNNLSYLDGLLKQLLKSKQSNYSEQCVSFYLDEDKYIIEDLHHINNHWSEKLKCTLIRHRSNKKDRQNQIGLNSKCIIYLHGLGSSRLESLSIIQHLPPTYCLFMFDMSGNGKSQGDYITYGLKECEDIDPIIQYLNKKKYIRQFILWGRSMGAVATLLYAIQYYKQTSNSRSRGILTANNSLRNSKIIGNSTQINEGLVKAIILDSPFHNFRDIAKQIATNKLSIPNFIVQLALDYVESSFTRILTNVIGDKYNPFLINFNKQINLSIPIIFLYSEKDEIVPAYHSQRIIKNIKTKFEKILINECNHNESRPSKIINQIFQKLDKFSRAKHYQNKKLSQSISKDVTINYSCQKKRGIFVYTPSRQKQYKTIDYDQQNSIVKNKRYQSIEISKCQSFMNSPKNQNSSLVGKRSRISIQSSKLVSAANCDFFNEDKFFSNIATIDTQTNNLISKKLIGIKDNQNNGTRKLRSKRFNIDRKKQVRLTHHKYLQ